jgi:hypothetical protein
VEGGEGLELVKKTISDAPDSIPWQAWASQGILCAPQNSFSFHGRYTKDSIFFPLGNTDSVYGLVYGAAGEQVHFYRGGGVVYTIEAPQPGASAREGSDPAPRPNPTPSSLESGDSVLYLVTCYFSSMVLDGGQSIIYIIDNIGDSIDPIYRRDHSDRSSKMEEYCAFGARAGADEAHAPLGTAAREEYTCNPTGASDFDASTPIMIPAENWCSRLAVFHHCLTVTMPDSTTHVINNVTCQVEITLMGDSVAIRSGCPTNSANCCGQDDPDR